MKYVLIFVLLIVAVALILPRVLPTDAAQWHVAPQADAVGDIATMAGFTAVRQITTTPEGLLKAVDQVAQSTPRTSVLAGSVDAGMVTYVTRSAVFGFPDYTTVTLDDGKLVIHARLRFGRSDMGVNKARVQGWLAQLGPLVVAP